MWHKRWMDLLKDFDYKIRYHPGKGNVVADAEILTHLMVSERELHEAMQQLQIQEESKGKFVASLRAQLTLIQRIKEGHMVDTDI